MNRSNFLKYSWVAAFAGLGYGAYYLWSKRTYLSSDVKAKLPLAKNLDTIPDQVGNYDMDGVSFDTEGVVVSGDNHKTVVAPI